MDRQRHARPAEDPRESSRGSKISPSRSSRAPPLAGALRLLSGPLPSHCHAVRSLTRSRVLKAHGGCVNTVSWLEEEDACPTLTRTRTPSLTRSLALALALSLALTPALTPTLTPTPTPNPGPNQEGDSSLLISGSDDTFVHVWRATAHPQPASGGPARLRPCASHLTGQPPRHLTLAPDADPSPSPNPQP